MIRLKVQLWDLMLCGCGIWCAQISLRMPLLPMLALGPGLMLYVVYCVALAALLVAHSARLARCRLISMRAWTSRKPSSSTDLE